MAQGLEQTLEQEGGQFYVDCMEQSNQGDHSESESGWFNRWSMCTLWKGGWICHSQILVGMWVCTVCLGVCVGNFELCCIWKCLG